MPKNYAEINNTKFDFYRGLVQAGLPSFLAGIPWDNETGENILDFGCGTGRMGKEFLESRVGGKSKVYGVDISESMIKYAKEQFQWPNVEYVLGDLLDEDFPLKDTKFDKAFAIYSLRLVEDERAYMEKIYNQLVPGGYMILIDFIDTPRFDLHAHLQEHPEWESHGKKMKVPDFHGADPEVCRVSIHRQYLESVGFKVQDRTTTTGSAFFPSADVLAEYIMSLNPHIHETHLKDDEEHEKLQGAMGDFLDNYEEKAKSGGDKVKKTEDGQVECVTTTVFLLAQKPQ